MYSNRDMLIEERDSLQKQMQQYHKTLMRLREQEASYGLHVPIDILNGIENAQENIDRITTRLQQVMTELEQLSPEAIAPDIQTEILPKGLGEDESGPQSTLLTDEPHSKSQPTSNPYANRAIIKNPTEFFGRTAELQDLFNLLAAMQSCSVVGPRRIGKSSLLYYLTQPAVYSPHLPDPNSYIFGYMDLQELASLEPDDFFYTAVEQLSRVSRGKLDFINLDRDGTKSGFRRFLMRVSDAGLRLVLCCDEFEMLSRNTHFEVDFFTYLRGLCSNYNLALVTSSRASLFDLCHQGDLQTSQFWNIFVERTLGLMPEPEATKLISDPFRSADGIISDEDVVFALNQAGRHPFFTQILCYHLFAAQSRNVSVDLIAVEQRFFDEARHHYLYAWEQLEEEEQTTLVALTQTKGQAIATSVFQRLLRSALVTGSPDSPALVSKGWRRFIESEVQTVPTNQSSVAPVETTTPLPLAPEVEAGYVDFEFKVEQIDSSSCRILVLDSPAGQDSVMCKLPFSLDEIGDVMLDLGQQIARGTAEQTLSQNTPVAIGEALFESVFSGPVSHLFFESTGRVHSQGQGLRIKIHVDPERYPQLAALPWEFLYNDRRRSFLSLSRLTPVVRYLDVQAPTTRPQISLPLRILVVITSPLGLPPLDLPREKEFIQQAWGSRPEVSVEFLDPATPSALQTKLWDWQPHVIHFMGHGHFDEITGAGALLLVDHRNKPKPITGVQLGVLLSNAPSVRLAFLNACQSATLSRSNDLDPFSGVATALVMAGLPAVVAMQFPISDDAALAFANGFYPRLATGDPIELAVSFGRESIRLEASDNPEWGTPVLFMRVTDGHLFEIGGVE